MQPGRVDRRPRRVYSFRTHRVSLSYEVPQHMSRYCDHDITAVLEAATSWRDRCLIADGSILSDQSLWVIRGLVELQRFFIEQPDETKRSFVEKLRDQLAPTAPQTKQLAAEMCWLLVLFPRASAMGGERKRELITTVWAWSGEALPLDRGMLRVPLEDGVGNPGTAYNTRRWAELAFLITAVHALKTRDRAERERLLADPWRFAAWLDGMTGTRAPAVTPHPQVFAFPRLLRASDHRSGQARYPRDIHGKALARCPRPEFLRC